MDSEDVRRRRESIRRRLRALLASEDMSAHKRELLRNLYAEMEQLGQPKLVTFADHLAKIYGESVGIKRPGVDVDRLAKDYAEAIRRERAEGREPSSADSELDQEPESEKEPLEEPEPESEKEPLEEPEPESEKEPLEEPEPESEKEKTAVENAVRRADSKVIKAVEALADFLDRAGTTLFCICAVALFFTSEAKESAEAQGADTQLSQLVDLVMSTNPGSGVVTGLGMVVVSILVKAIIVWRPER